MSSSIECAHCHRDMTPKGALERFVMQACEYVICPDCRDMRDEARKDE